jgi:hypothetical protein
MQIIAYDTLPQTIRCSTAQGGNCQPGYQYQWQESDNQLNWADIPGAGSQNLTFQAPLVQTKFYRRRVTETGSGSIGYSDVADVFVDPETR